MFTRSRVTTFAVVLLAASSLFVATSKPAQAFIWNPFENMVQSMLTTMSGSMDSMLDTMLALSGDIGTMADRIMVMADNIGIMADRIVTTEQLMADLVRDVTDSHGPAALILSPSEGATVSLSAATSISLSNGASDYVLFFSNNADMVNASNILVTEQNTSAAWSRAADYATGDQLYIAAKALSGSTMGPISNTVMLNIVP